MTRYESLCNITGGKVEWYREHQKLVDAEARAGVVWDGNKGEHVAAGTTGITCPPRPVNGRRMTMNANEHAPGPNARLIAAAPELLAALQAFMRAPSVGSAGSESIDIRVQNYNLDAARAAIAKATSH